MSKPNYIKKIEIIGIHNLFDIYQEFEPGINTIFGLNGVGKTTLIHVLANILNGDYYRFFEISFYKIRVVFDNENIIELSQKTDYANDEEHLKICVNNDRRGIILRRIKNENEVLNEYDEKDNSLEKTLERYTKDSVVLPSAYFPAFRNMIEAWKSIEDNTDIDNTTSFARKVFGHFTPELNYPSIKNIHNRLVKEIETIGERIKEYDRSIIAQLSISLMSNINQYSDIEKDIELIKDSIENIYQQIELLPISKECYLSSTEVYQNGFQMLNSSTLTQEATIFLELYFQALQNILNQAKKEFDRINKFLFAVNKFLNGKTIYLLKPHNLDYSSSIQVKFDDNKSINQLDVLSSGERHILTIIYSATYVSQKKIVLIDEPEISLHIDWQRKLMAKMSEQLSYIQTNDIQIIACTHSPMITVDHSRQELNLKFTDPKQVIRNEDEDENSEIILNDDNNEETEELDEYDSIADY